MATKRNGRQQADEQRRKSESQAAKEADARRDNQPYEVLQKSIMQRQGKNMHQQDKK